MRVRCDGCGQIQFDQPVVIKNANGSDEVQPDDTLHLHTYHKDGYFVWELRTQFGVLVAGADAAPGSGHLCPELQP